MCWVELGHVEDVGWEEPQENGQCGEKKFKLAEEGKEQQWPQEQKLALFPGPAQRHRGVESSWGRQLFAY